MDHVTVIHHHPWARRGLEQALIASGGFAVTVCASAAVGITAVRERPRTNVLVAYALPALDDLSAACGSGDTRTCRSR